MLALTQSPFLKALGWSLLNSLWQFGILWLVFYLFMLAGRKYSAAIKHGFALVLMSAGFAWFAGDLSFRYFAFTEQPEPGFSSYFLSGNGWYTLLYNNIKSFLQENLSYLSIIYLLVVTGFFVRFFQFFSYSHKIQTRGLTKVRPELRLYIQKIVQQLEIARKVQVWVSEHVDSPMVMGFLKPVILLPVASINQLSTTQLEAVLLHELAHIKRNDYLVNLYSATIEILFFFNPFARLLVRSLKQEREESCDDWVLQFRFDPYQYATALLSLEKSRAARYSLAIGATGGKKNLLLHRVQRIMGIRKAKQESGFRGAAYFLTIGILAFIALVNPGNIVVEDLERIYVNSINFTPTTTNTETTTVFTSTTTNSALDTLSTAKIATRKRQSNTELKEEDVDLEETSIVVPASMQEEDAEEMLPQLAVLESPVAEVKAFSIKDNEIPAPEVIAETEFPFVPHSSYSFFVTEDSMLLRLKAEKNRELHVTQSSAQAKKAIEKLNWEQIAKSQNLSKTAAAKLKKELEKSLNELNWTQIYREAIDSLNKASTATMRATLKQEYDKAKSYKALQDEFETIRKQIQTQQEKYKKGVEVELKQIEKEVKKTKVIVYI